MAKEIKSGTSLAEPVRYSQKEKMHYFAKQSKKGAKDSSGKEISDFMRGKNLGKAEEIGKSLGAYKFANSDDAGKATLKAKRAEIKADKLKKYADYKAKQGK